MIAYGRFDATLEELGHGKVACLEIEIHYEADPGEPRTWDYPGSPAHIVLYGVTVKSYENEDFGILRRNRPDWFELLDEIAFAAVMDEEEYFTQMIGEALDEREAAEQ